MLHQMVARDYCELSGYKIECQYISTSDDFIECGGSKKCFSWDDFNVWLIFKCKRGECDCVHSEDVDAPRLRGAVVVDYCVSSNFTIS